MINANCRFFHSWKTIEQKGIKSPAFGLIIVTVKECKRCGETKENWD